MPYFLKFPVLQYPVKDGSTFKFVFVSNLLRRVALNQDLKNSEGVFLEYSIKDGERPEHIAERVYGDPSYHWLILMTNDVIDPYHGWYKSGVVLEEQIRKKHGSTSVFFTNTQDQFLYNTNFVAGCTVWQNNLNSKVLDYFPSMAKFTVDKPVFSNTPGVTTFVEMPSVDTKNYMHDSYALSGFPSSMWGFEYNRERVSIADELGIPQTKRNEMAAISPYWVKATKNSSNPNNGRVFVLDPRPPNSTEHLLVQGNMYRIQYYVYSQDTNLTNVRFDTDDVQINNRTVFTSYQNSDVGSVVRLKSQFFTQSLGSAQSQGNLMVLRTGNSNPVGTVLYITGIELNKLNTVDIKPHRVEQSARAAHHFEVKKPSNMIGANELLEVDPLSKESSNYYTQSSVTVGLPYPGSTGAPVAFGETFIGKYMGLCGGVQSNTYAVNNQSNEDRKNENMRTIKILHPQYKGEALKQLEELLRV